MGVPCAGEDYASYHNPKHTHTHTLQHVREWNVIKFVNQSLG